MVCMSTSKRISHKWSIIVTWLLAVVIGVTTVTLTKGGQSPGWFLLAIGTVTLIAGALQLIVADKDGFIVRISLSISGALILLLLTIFSVFLL